MNAGCWFGTKYRMLNYCQMSSATDERCRFGGKCRLMAIVIGRMSQNRVMMTNGGFTTCQMERKITTSQTNQADQYSGKICVRQIKYLVMGILSSHSIQQLLVQSLWISIYGQIQIYLPYTNRPSKNRLYQYRMLWKMLYFYNKLPDTEMNGKEILYGP